MAMVFMSERNLDTSQTDKQNSNLGPGEYLSQSPFKKVNVNKQPFLTGSPRSKFDFKDTPGPGAYYHDETHNNYLKNLYNEKISMQNDKINLLIKGERENLTKLILLMNSEKKGFNIKSKRFRIVNSTNSQPGPGQYFQNTKLEKFEKKKVKKLKENEAFISKKLSIIKSSEFQKIPTIPSKDKKFGFDILNNGTLIQKQNPDMYRTFTGEKGDTVGPGSYEIEKPNNWHKTGTSWSKFRVVRDCNKNLNKNDFSSSMATTNYSDFKKNNNNNLISGVLGSNSSDFTDRTNLNINSKSNINNVKKSSTNKKTNKKNVFNLKIETCKINNKKKSQQPITFENIIKKVTPGPGYYYDQRAFTSFKVKYVPEYKQYFGSKLARFLTNKSNATNSLGPGDYFKEEKNKMDNNNSNKGAPFSSSIERFPYSEQKLDGPGPGEYDNSNQEQKNKIPVSDNKFGSTEIRFNNMYNLSWKSGVPGPGFYSPDNHSNKLNKTGKNFNKRGQLFSTTKNDLEKYNYNKINNSSDELKDSVPPIGLYNPEIVSSIDYKVKKKVYETKNQKVAFSSSFNKRKKTKNNIVINCENSNLGPGYYYHDRKKIDNRLSPPFHLPEFKRNIRSNANIFVGPGKYDLDSYNTWNKKSFNINFV